jgi:hypothetical protein
MNAKPTISLSARTHARAEQRSREEGFESVDAYVEALISEDDALHALPEWMKLRLAEGLASPSAGELTPEKIERLVEDGVAHARRPG